MTNYKKKLLKYKSKYLNEIKKKYIYGGYDIEAEINVNEFISILNNDVVSLGLQKHSENYMFERDIGHDFGQSQNPIKSTIPPVDGFFIDHPDSQKTNISDHKTYKQDTEGDYGFQYLYNNKNLELFYIKHELEWDKGINENIPDTVGDKNCYIEGLNSKKCPVIDDSDETNLVEINLPNNIKNIDDIIIKPYIMADSAWHGHWHKFNLTWPNLFDSANYGSQHYNNIPDNQEYKLLKDKTPENINEMIRFLTAKCEQLLIFTMFTKIGNAGNNCKNSWTNYESIFNKSQNETYIDSHMDELYIAINIMRLLHIRVNKKKFKNNNIYIEFYFKNFNKSKLDFYFDIKEKYNINFPNQYFNIIDDEILTNETLAYLLPMSQADAYSAFMENVYQDHARSKGDIDKTDGIKDNINDIIKKILFKIGITDEDKHNKIIMIIGMLFKYTFGDTAYILAQIYDKKYRGENSIVYTRSVDSFLNIRNTMFENSILGNLKNAVKDRVIYLPENLFFKNLRHTLHSGHTPKSPQEPDIYQYYYSIKDSYSIKDYFTEFDTLNNIWNNAPEFLKRFSYWKMYQELLIPLQQEEHKKFANQQSDDTMNFDTTHESVFNDFKTATVTANKIIDIFDIIYNYQKNDTNNIISLTYVDNSGQEPNGMFIDDEKDFYINKCRFIVEDFIFLLIKFYDDRHYISHNKKMSVLINKFFTFIDDEQHDVNNQDYIDKSPKRKNLFENLKNVFDNIIFYTNFFNSLSSVSTNLVDIDQHIGYIYKIFESLLTNSIITRHNHHLTTNIQRSISRRFKGKNDLLFLNKNDEFGVNDVTSTNFLNTFYDEILRKVMLNKDRGWIVFEKVSIIFNNLTNSINTFYENYNIVIQQGGTSSETHRTKIINYITSTYSETDDINLTNIIIYFIHSILYDKEPYCPHADRIMGELLEQNQELKAVTEQVENEHNNPSKTYNIKYSDISYDLNDVQLNNKDYTIINTITKLMDGLNNNTYINLFIANEEICKNELIEIFENLINEELDKFEDTSDHQSIHFTNFRNQSIKHILMRYLTDYYLEEINDDISKKINLNYMGFFNSILYTATLVATRQDISDDIIKQQDEDEHEFNEAAKNNNIAKMNELNINIDEDVNYVPPGESSSDIIIKSNLKSYINDYNNLGKLSTKLYEGDGDVTPWLKEQCTVINPDERNENLVMCDFIFENIYRIDNYDNKYNFITHFNKCFKLYFLIYCKNNINSNSSYNDIFNLYIISLYSFYDNIVDTIFNKNLYKLCRNFKKEDTIIELINNNDKIIQPILINILLHDEFKLQFSETE